MLNYLLMYNFMTGVHDSATAKWPPVAPLLAFLQGMCPASWAQIAVNPGTNKIFAGNETLPYVNGIDGATHELTSIEIGGTPGPIVVNPVTNKIYVGFLATIRGNSTVVVIDGATNQVTKVAVPASPYALAVNTVTNKVYVADYYGGKVTAIDGFTNQTVTVQVGLNPVSVAVNPETNMTYLGNWNSAEATIIDGATNATTKVPISGKSEGHSIAVNTVTNKIYIGSYAQSKRVSVVDGLTNQMTAIQTGRVCFWYGRKPRHEQNLRRERLHR